MAIVIETVTATSDEDDIGPVIVTAATKLVCLFTVRHLAEANRVSIGVARNSGAEAFTQAIVTDDNDRMSAEGWWYDLPATGLGGAARDVVVDLTNSVGFFGGTVWAITGAAPGAPLAAASSVDGAETNGANPSLTLASQAGGLVLDAAVWDGVDTYAVGAGQALDYNNVSTRRRVSSSKAATGTSTTMSHTNAARQHRHVAVSLAPAIVASGPTLRQNGLALSPRQNGLALNAR